MGEILHGSHTAHSVVWYDVTREKNDGICQIHHLSSLPTSGHGKNDRPIEPFSRSHHEASA